MKEVMINQFKKSSFFPIGQIEQNFLQINIPIAFGWSSFKDLNIEYRGNIDNLKYVNSDKNTEEFGIDIDRNYTDIFNKNYIINYQCT